MTWFWILVHTQREASCLSYEYREHLYEESVKAAFDMDGVGRKENHTWKGQLPFVWVRNEEKNNKKIKF